MDGTDDDAVVSALTRAATRAVEAAARRLMMPQAWRWTLDAWPQATLVDLPLAPVRSIAGVRIIGANGAATVLPSADFALDAASDPPRLAILRPQPAPGRAFAGIEIDVQAGHADAASVPEPLRQAVRIVLAQLYERRGEGEATVPLPLAAQILVAPFVRRRLA